MDQLPAELIVIILKFVIDSCPSIKEIWGYRLICWNLADVPQFDVLSEYMLNHFEIRSLLGVELGNNTSTLISLFKNHKFEIIQRNHLGLARFYPPIYYPVSAADSGKNIRDGIARKRHMPPHRISIFLMTADFKKTTTET